MKSQTTFFRLFAVMASFLSSSFFCLAQEEYPADFNADQLYFRKITSTDELTSEALYIIVTEDGKKGLMLTSTTTNIKSADVSTSKGIYQGKVSASGFPYEMEIRKEDKKYLIRVKNSVDKYFYLTATSATGVKVSSTQTGSYYWTISFDKDGFLQLYNTKEPGYSMCYLVSDDRFACRNLESTSDTYQKLYLYRKESLIQISDKTDGFATFYNKDFLYCMPEGLEGYAVEEPNEENTTITTTLAYPSPYFVPMGMALLIHGSAGAHRAPVISYRTNVYTATNYLEGTRDENENTSSAQSGSVEYFKLGLGDSQDRVGFYWGADNGGPFKLTKAHTAYLALPTTNGTSYANGLSLHYNETTGLQILPKISSPDFAKGLFDLSGRRLRQAPRPGIYIQNGKKIILK